MSETKTPWVLTVGQPFSHERSKWEDGRIEYRFFSGNHMLQLCLGQLTPQEIKAFRKNPVRVALFIEGNVIFFIFKIEGCMDWSDQGFSIHLVHEQNRDLPSLPPGMRTPLNLVLVDADTGIVRALRMVTFSPHFSRLLHDAMRRQIELPFEPAVHQAVIQDVYRRYPRTADLAKAAVIIEKAGAKFP